MAQQASMKSNRGKSMSNKTRKKGKKGIKGKTRKKGKKGKTRKKGKKSQSIIAIPYGRLNKTNRAIITKAIHNPLTQSEADIYNKLRNRYTGAVNSEKWNKIRRVKVNKIIKLVTKQLHTKNTYPVVGIITIPVHTKTRAQTHSYLPQSYVKWVEMSGMRVVPIQHDIPKGVLDHLLRHIHGILIPGGVVEENMLQNDYYTFINTCKHVFQFAKISNLRGNYFPIMGTCLGHEIMTIMALFKNTKHIAKSFKDCTKISKIPEHGAAKLHFTNFNGKIKALFTDKERQIFAKENVLSMHHDYSFDMKAKYIKEMLKHINVAAVNYGSDGKHPYISTAEHKLFPFYSVQWHPEHPLFEWRDPTSATVPHNKYSRIISSRISNFFADECRKNTNIWIDADDNLLIYNYNLFSRQDVKKLLHPNGTIGTPNRWFDSSYYFGNVNINLNLY